MNKKVTLGFTALALLASTVAATTVTTTVDAKAKEKNNNGGTIFNTGIINSFKTETVQVGEHNISYLIRKGNANPTKTYIVSHGATGTNEYMKVFAGELAKKEPNARIILVDLPLHGDSTGPMDNLSDITVHDYTNIMYDFLDLKTKDGTIKGTVNWTGWSMGGSIGLLLDLKGANLDELTLLNSAPVWESIVPIIPLMPVEVIKDAYYQVTVGEVSTNLSEKDRQDILNNYHNLITSSADVMAQDFQALTPEHYDVRDLLQNVKAKTLIVSGTQDVLTEVKLQELMDEKIQDSKLIMYEEGHTQMIKPVQAEKIVNEMNNYFNKK